MTFFTKVTFVLLSVGMTRGLMADSMDAVLYQINTKTSRIGFAVIESPPENAHNQPMHQIMRFAYMIDYHVNAEPVYVAAGYDGTDFWQAIASKKTGGWVSASFFSPKAVEEMSRVRVLCSPTGRDVNLFKSLCHVEQMRDSIANDKILESPNEIDRNILDKSKKWKVHSSGQWERTFSIVKSKSDLPDRIIVSHLGGWSGPWIFPYPAELIMDKHRRVKAPIQAVTYDAFSMRLKTASGNGAIRSNFNESKRAKTP